MQNKMLLNGRFGPLTGGFTLIELLVVVLIIGILTSVALPQYNRSVAKARAVQEMIWIESVVAAEKRYHLATGQFTNQLDNLDIGAPNIDLSNYATPQIGSPVNAHYQDVSVTLRRDKQGLPQYALQATIFHGENSDKIEVKRKCFTHSGDQNFCKAFTNGRPCTDYTGHESPWCYN